MTKVRFGLAGCLVVLGVLVACGPTKGPISTSPPSMWVPATGAPEGKAVLTFYRESRVEGGWRNSSVFIDGLEIADLDNGTYVSATVDPGLRKVHSDEEEDELLVAVEAEREYFFRIVINRGFWVGNFRLEQTSGPEGQDEFRALGLKQGKDIRVPEMVIASPSVASH